MKKETKLNEYEIGMLSPGDKILVAIPTRDRPEYLSILLSSLIHQTEQAFDVLIVDTSDEKRLDVSSAPVERFLSTLTALGHSCFYEHVKVAGRSEAAAVNFLLTEAVFKGYEYLYKTDDDHLLQPDTLERLKKSCKELMQKHVSPVLVSVATPYMKRVNGFEGPEACPVISWPENHPVIKLGIEEGELVIEPGQFIRGMTDLGIRRSDLASAANFFMKPDARILWEDLGHSSMHADAVWMVQIAKFFGYKFFFDMGCVSWHVTAPSGGVREEYDNYTKVSEWDLRRREHLKYVMTKLSEYDPSLIKKMPHS
jgi:glycosyltransferase involved in cell wall biosynthesis